MSWKNIELAKVCDVFADGDWIESKDQSDIGIRLIQTGNVGFGRFKARDSKARYISEETFKRLRCTEIKEGDLLVSRLPDPVGRACIIPQLVDKSITAVDCTIIRTKQEILYSNYLNYYCQSPQYFEQVKKNITGATRQRISRSLLGKTLIPLAPIATQQKIVAKLDAIFAEIDTATAAAETNAKNAEALFKTYLSDIFQSENPNFISKPIGEIGEIFSGAGFPVNQQGLLNEDIPFYKVSDMNLVGNEKYMISHNNSISRETAKQLGAKIIPTKSIIFPKIGGAIATNKKRILSIPSCVDNNVMAIYPNDKLVNPDFFFHLFSSIELSSFANEAALPSIKKSTVEERLVKIPNSLREQERICELINTLKDISYKLKDDYLVKLKSLTLLKQSILKQAFNGELVKE